MRIEHFFCDFKRFPESILFVFTFNKSNFSCIYLRWEPEMKARSVIFSRSSLFYGSLSTKSKITWGIIFSANSGCERSNSKKGSGVCVCWDLRVSFSGYLSRETKRHDAHRWLSCLSIGLSGGRSRARTPAGQPANVQMVRRSSLLG